jgi:hypothetical protein
LIRGIRACGISDSGNFADNLSPDYRLINKKVL